MVERRFLRRPQNAAATNSNRTSIDIHWREGVAQGIEIRQRSIEAATEMRFIYLRTGRLRSGDVPLAFFARASMVFAEKAGSHRTSGSSSHSKNRNGPLLA
jgi:hypothetical protein